MNSSHLLFLSPHTPTNVLNWSGTLTSLHRALKDNDLKVALHTFDGGLPDKIAQQINRALYHCGLRFDCRFSTLYAVLAGVYLSAQLALAPNGPIVAVIAANYVPYLLTRRRILYISDATFRAAAQLYPNLKALPQWLYQQYDRNEARTLHRADAIILPSRWASESAERDYGIERTKIFEIPFGANIPNELIQEHYKPKSIDGGDVVLLFVSADWQRKGGDKAVDVSRALIERSVQARLIIVGDAPQHVAALPFVEVKGFLKKSEPTELLEICRSYSQAHFFILPTEADASPIVFSECRAFGVPPITHDVGGTASAITHGSTGLLLPRNASAELFADQLLRYVREPLLYERLSEQCRQWYVDDAQWSNWSNLIIRLAGFPHANGHL